MKNVIVIDSDFIAYNGRIENYSQTVENIVKLREKNSLGEELNEMESKICDAVRFDKQHHNNNSFMTLQSVSEKDNGYELTIYEWKDLQINSIQKTLISPRMLSQEDLKKMAYWSTVLWFDKKYIESGLCESKRVVNKIQNILDKKMYRNSFLSNVSWRKSIQSNLVDFLMFTTHNQDDTYSHFGSVVFKEEKEEVIDYLKTKLK